MMNKSVLIAAALALAVVGCGDNKQAQDAKAAADKAAASAKEAADKAATAAKDAGNAAVQAGQAAVDATKSAGSAAMDCQQDHRQRDEVRHSGAGAGTGTHATSGGPEEIGNRQSWKKKPACRRLFLRPVARISRLQRRADAACHLAVFLDNAAQIAAEAVLVHLLVCRAIPEAAAIRRKLVAQP